MTEAQRFVDHSVQRDDRDDGTIILRSGLDLGPVARNTGDWLHRWASATPRAVFIAERAGDGWREVGFADMLGRVRRVAAGLLHRGVGPGQSIVILSGPSVDHAILMLAAQYIGAITVPLAEQYSLIPAARSRLTHCAARTSPAMVYAADGDRFAAALALPVFDGVARCVSASPGPGMTRFDQLAHDDAAAVDAAHARVGPDTVAKILFTSGSTSDPKAVPQTQRMLCVNQAQYLACLPILGAKRHKMLDWLPWNHVFAGNANFNLMLSTGGALYLDDGKPTPALAQRTVDNMARRPSTLCFDVPAAHAMQMAALKADPELRRKYFKAMDIFFYAGASLPADVWDAVADMCVEVTGETPMMMSSWGLTETAPAALIYHEKGGQAGMVGVPPPGVDVKLIPIGENRFEVRVRGPNVFTGYLDDPARSAAAFDDEGYFRTGDAMRLVNPGDASRGLLFDGRIGEDFKLTSGTWVRASTLRLQILAGLGDLAQDVIVVGEGRAEPGLLVFPPPVLGLAGAGGAVSDRDYTGRLRWALAGIMAGVTGSSNRVSRAMVMAEPPDVGAGEITAKGSLNVGAITRRRAALIDRLYDDADPATISLKETP